MVKELKSSMISEVQYHIQDHNAAPEMGHNI